MGSDRGAADGAGVPELVGGRYLLGPVIGAGSSATVHRARDLRRGRTVAVKVFRQGASDNDLRQQRREMAALTQLDHPGLVALHDGGSEDGRAFVVTDLVEGPTLAERLGWGRPLAPGAARRLGALLAGALAHVHAAGIVHRDVKPANVLLGDGGRPRLADFGISRALDDTTATASGSVVGTAAYLAPEQVRGEHVGPAADIYALGLVLLEAVTGNREYPGLAVESATARLHRAPVVPARLPSGLGAVITAMTRVDPALRPTAAEVAAAFTADPASPAAALRSRGSRRSVAGRHRMHVPSRTSSRLALAGLTVVAAMLSVAAAPVPSSAAGPPAERAGAQDHPGRIGLSTGHP